MTNQNNAAQPTDVLVDYEVYQEDELVASSNSLAHAEQYAEQYGQDGPVELRTSISIPGFHAVESALLSKLRAPVADEREAFEAFQRGTGLDELYLERHATSGHYMWTATKENWETWQRRAALASAPVAGEAHPVAWLHQCRKKPELATVTMNKREPELAAKGYRPIPLYAAPQASEAVREAVPASFDQKAREVAHSVSFYGSIENRVQQAAQLQLAVAEAMQWAARAALSAQPGAQNDA